MKGQSNLIFQTAYWGDLLLAVPLMRAVRRQFPKHSLVLACRSTFGKFFLDQGLVDQIIEVDKSWAASRREFIAKLRQREWDWVFCPHMSLRSALWVKSLKAQNRVGFQTWWNGWAFEKRVVRPMSWPDGLRQLSLLCPASPEISSQMRALEEQLETLPSGFGRMRSLDDHLAVPQWAAMALVDPAQEGSFRGPNPKVFIAPGSTWPTKRWTVDGFAEVARRLVEHGAEVILVGTKKERAICEQVQREAVGSKNLAGETEPAELFHLFLSGDLLLTNDSGAMHMGSLASIPTVSIFGPTTLELGYRPWQNRAVVVETDLDCRPCGKHGHQKCPLGTHACMTQISAAQVLAAIGELVPNLQVRS